MSMITEQVSRLRDRAEGCFAIGDFVTAEIFRNAADTIEQLSAKVREDNAYQKAFEDIRAELRQKQWHIGVDSANQVIEIIDKHDPSKAGKENNV